MAHDVFISHSSADKPAADAACAALEASGIRCWIAPRDIKPSESWAAAIVEAIRGARIFLLVFSRHANESDQVQREVERAANSGKLLLTLRIEDVTPQAALEYYLSTPHWLDAITPPFRAHLDKLADACSSLLALPPTDQDSVAGAPAPVGLVSKQGAPQSVSSQHGRSSAAIVEKSFWARSQRAWLIAALVVAVLACGGLLLRNVVSPKTGGELVLTSATDPGVNPFMASAAAPPPTNTQPAPTLQAHGQATTVATQPLPGDRDGLYGGTLNNAECDREKMISFLSSHPAQAGAFVEALNTDPTVFWSGAHPLTAADIPTYLGELTPVLLRLDTRVSNHGFDGTGPTTVQSVFQAGTGVLVDARGVPRARCYCGNPLTAPIALSGEPQTVGTAWPHYNPAALAAVEPSPVIITTFILLDVLTGQPFNRPAATTGADDTPHSQPLPPFPPPPPPTATGHSNQLDIDGSYLLDFDLGSCKGAPRDSPVTITQQSNALTLVGPSGITFTGTINADGSFFLSESPTNTMRGVFATEGGRTVIRDGIWESFGPCTGTFEGTKQ